MFQQLIQKLRSVDGRCALALVYTAVALTLLEYGYYPPRVEGRLQGLEFGSLRPPSLAAGQHWAVATILGNMVLPLGIVFLIHREGPRSIGYRLGGFVRHLWVYLLLFAVVMVPVIAFAAQRPAFQNTYPFVREATVDLRTFLIWEAFYLTQFLALESFFRGYLLFTLERKIGWLAIFVMAVPYCMIHYHKPPLEALAAIVAGIALGALALSYRSWYGGALLHILVAASMDGLSAHRAGLF